ncbi:MAG: nitroreductase family protein [Pirellulales bacterium]|nr:nitroreductase family protein [Pirellulales bacterium]
MGFSFHVQGRPEVDSDLCTGCGQCVAICPDQIYTLENRKARPGQGVFLGCIACGHCVAVCPVGAIAVTGRGMTADDRRPLPDPASRATAESLENLLLARRSIRKYQDREVEREKLDRILAAAAAAPMGIPPSDVHVLVFSNRQQVRAFTAASMEAFRRMNRMLGSWIFKLLSLRTSKAEKEIMRDFIAPLMRALVEYYDAGEDIYTYNAPAALLFHHGPHGDKSEIAIAATYAMLAAESLGLGSCMIGSSEAFNHDSMLKQHYGIPKEHKVGMALLIGYPAVKFHHALHRRLGSVRFAE